MALRTPANPYDNGPADTFIGCEGCGSPVDCAACPRCEEPLCSCPCARCYGCGELVESCRCQSAISLAAEFDDYDPFAEMTCRDRWAA